MKLVKLNEKRLYLIAKNHMESLDENMSPRRESDYGTSNPVVARFVIQTHNLLKDSLFSSEVQNKVMAIYFSIHKRLLICNETLERLKMALVTALNRIPKSKDPRLKPVAFIPNLESDAGKIIYELKNILRDVVSILNPLYGKKFTEASALYPRKQAAPSDVQSWAMGKFDKNEPFCLFVGEEVDWIEELIRKRNAVEHPGGYSGTLSIENMKLLEDGRMLLPVWYRTGMPPIDILSDLDALIHNCFTYAEDFLALAIKADPAFKQYMDIFRIPKDKINPDCPVTYQTGPNAEFLSKIEADTHTSRQRWKEAPQP